MERFLLALQAYKRMPAGLEQILRETCTRSPSPNMKSFNPPARYPTVSNLLKKACLIFLPTDKESKPLSDSKGKTNSSFP